MIIALYCKQFRNYDLPIANLTRVKHTTKIHSAPLNKKVAEWNLDKQKLGSSKTA